MSSQPDARTSEFPGRQGLASHQPGTPHPDAGPPGAIVGFTVTRGIEPGRIQAARAAEQRALRHFPQLSRLTLDIGETQLAVWGRGQLSACLHTCHDGSVLVLVGNPVGSYSWQAVEHDITDACAFDQFELPADGRLILVHIATNGRQWTVWNDWIGSIPVYYASVKGGRIASTLQPAAVASAGFARDDIFLPALLSLFIHGHMLADWTLYKGLRVLPPDSVSRWTSRAFITRLQSTVVPSTERWEASWDDLADEMQALVFKAIAGALKGRPSWTVPLSSGLDSRLIAAVGARLGVEMKAFTWGGRKSEDAIYARQVARVLGLSWKWVDTGNDYLAKYGVFWSDLFGSAMHFHGMYQMAFLDAVTREADGAVASGFLGECLAGFDVEFQTHSQSSSQRAYQTHPDDWLLWPINEARSLFRASTDEPFEEMAAAIDTERNRAGGPWFERLRFLTLWGRQRHFTYFQAVLDDYWLGVATPYLDRAYARFCHSLPRVALGNRLLQGEMFRRHYGLLATIPGSYAPDPFILTGRYLLKRRVARSLPPLLRIGFFRDSQAVPLSRDGQAAQHSGEAAFWPVFEAWNRLEEWVDLDVVRTTYESAVTGDIRAVRKMQAVQALAYCLVRD